MITSMLWIGAGGKLRGKHLALLIADGLPVDDKADLRVIAKRVEQTVAIRGNAAGAVRDRLAQSAARIAGGKFDDQRLRSTSMWAEGSFSSISAPAASTVTLLTAPANVQLGLELDREWRYARSHPAPRW